MPKGRWAYRPTTRRLHSIAGAAHRGNRTVGNPFLTTGLEWCHVCKGEMDTDTEASHRDSMYVFKRWCRRCGTVLKWGNYNVPIMHGSPLPAMALEWCTKPGQDRR